MPAYRNLTKELIAFGVGFLLMLFLPPVAFFGSIGVLAFALFAPKSLNNLCKGDIQNAHAIFYGASLLFGILGASVILTLVLGAASFVAQLILGLAMFMGLIHYVFPKFVLPRL